MRTYRFLILLVSRLTTGVISYAPATQCIIDNALADGINLTNLPFAYTALSSLQDIAVPIEVNRTAFMNATKVDTHVHIVPEWYKAIVPTTGGSPTPSWDAQTHFQFIAANGIKHSYVSISAPGTGVYNLPGGYSEQAAADLARLLNEYLAALVKAYPEYLSFYSVMPLPYSESAIKEAKHALDHLSARGIGLLSNHEGKYLGNSMITPFFAWLNNRTTSKEIIFVHPNEPVLDHNGTLISANPTPYPSGLVEFYYETARTFMDLTISRTILNFTSLYWIVPHGGGSFPAIDDRFIKSIPGLEVPSKAAFNFRLFWDSAGPVYFDQIKGLLGYGMPTSQLTFGTDFPYAPNYAYASSIAAIVNATFLGMSDKQRIFTSNAEALFNGSS